MVIPREAGRTTYSTEIRNLKERLSLSDYQRSVIVGSLLGDGGLTPNWSKTNYRFHVAQSVKQEAYLWWKYRVLKDWILSKPRYYARNRSITIKTISHREITDLARLFYPKSRKVLPKELAVFIRDPVILAVWFMDDGNVIQRNGKFYGYHLNTQSFNKEENRRLSKIFLAEHGIESMLERNHGRYRIRIMRKESRIKFRELIRSHILPEMAYKLG